MSKKEEPFLLKYLKHEGKEIRKFLTSRDLLIFIFFLLVSTGLWSLQAMRKEYETIISIPITYEKAPEGLVQQAELPQRLLVTVTDDGTSLVRNRWMHSYTPIAIDISAYTGGTYSLPTAEFESEIQKQLNTTTKIVRIAPASIELEFKELSKKEVPVVFNGTIRMAQQYIRQGELEIKPSHITIYGINSVIDSIDHIDTEYAELSDISGTINKRIKLTSTPNVSFSHDSVSCIQHSERYTEKVLEVPVRTKKVEKGYKIRTFPVMVKVKFHVGLSNYDKVTADKLTVFANPEDAVGSRIPLRITGAEDMINSIEIMPSSVDYLTEKND